MLVLTRVHEQQSISGPVAKRGQTRQRKGKVTASPRAKAKVKARARENIQEKETTTRLSAGHPRTETQDDVGHACSEKESGVPLDRKESGEVH